MQNSNVEQQSERGFILVTSIILLAILMGLGAAAMFKSQVEIKVSASAVESAQALAAAQAGLDKTYAYWSGAGSTQFTDIAAAATSGTVGAGLPLNDLFPTSVSGAGGLGATAADVDVTIQGSNAVVYTMTSAGMSLPQTGAFWNSSVNGTDTYAQVAVWTTRFQPSPTGYPYATHKTIASGACSGCTAVTYTLGRSGNAYKLLREYAFSVSSTIQAFGAMMNAPKYDGDTHCQNPGTVPNPLATPTPANTNPLVATTLWKTSHMIDATQSPGGVAMASNNGINPADSNKSWGDGQNGSGTGLTTNKNGVNRVIDMFVIYDPGKVAVANYPDVAGNNMSQTWAVTVSDSLFNSTPMDFFSNGSQLFPLDAYREAANRISGFATETIGAAPAVPATGGNPAIPAVIGHVVNTNTTALTTEVDTLKSNNNNNGRAGTLNVGEWQYNIQRNIPMYGLLRFMVPMTATNTTNKSVCGRNNITQYQPSTTYFGNNSVLAPNGLQSPNGKLIVYGGALFDFFFDTDNDGIYTPGTDRLLTRDEAQVSSKLNVDNPLMFNPVMDGMSPRLTVPAPACTDILNIACYPNGSPSWDVYTDAFSYQGAAAITGNGTYQSVADGVMDLIWDVDNIARTWPKNSGYHAAFVGGAGFKGLMNQESPAVIISTATNALGSHIWKSADKDKMWELLDYYIRTTSAGSKSIWKNSTGVKEVGALNIEQNYANFYIDTQNDLSRPEPSAADLYHAFLPSGYIHGWKRAFEMTGLANVSQNDNTKSIWNNDLIQDNAAPGTISPFTARESDIFNISGIGSTARVDEDFRDVPAEMYAGGLVDMHHAVNTSGVVYTPDMLELEQKDKGVSFTLLGNAGTASGTRAALQYMNGIVISGGGVYMKDETNLVNTVANARTVIAYDDTSIDNLPTNSANPVLGRKYKQEMK